MSVPTAAAPPQRTTPALSPRVSAWHVVTTRTESTLGRHLRRLGPIQGEDGVFRELFLACFFRFAPWLWKQVQVFRNRAGTPCGWHGTYNLGAQSAEGELDGPQGGLHKDLPHLFAASNFCNKNS